MDMRRSYVLARAGGRAQVGSGKDAPPTGGLPRVREAIRRFGFWDSPIDVWGLFRHARVVMRRSMKLRLDLLEFLTDEDIMEEVLANNHRYKPEPNFSKTGVGTLSLASIEERAQEETRSTALIEILKERAKKSRANSRS